MEKTKTMENSKSEFPPFLFAEDLVSYCMESRDVKWKSSSSFHDFRHLIETTFSSDIGKAVNFFPTYFGDNLDEIKTYMIPYFVSDPREFSNFVFYLADRLFSSDLYLEFLMFCGSVIDIADGLHQTGLPEFMDRAIVSIAFIFDIKLKDNFELRGGWKAFRLYCLEFNNEVKDCYELCTSSEASGSLCLELSG